MSTASLATGDTSRPLLDETIDANFRRAVATWPEREALVVPHQDVRWTYAELDERIDEVARALLATGVEAGDRMGVWSPNRYEWVLIQYATARVGAIMVCLNPAYRTHELAYALTQSGISLLFAASTFKTSDYEAMVAEVVGDCPALQEAVFFGTPSWDALVARAGGVTSDDVKARAATLSADDAINIQYTSGTTGLPKGATLTHRNILNNGYFVGEACSYTHEEGDAFFAFLAAGSIEPWRPESSDQNDVVHDAIAASVAAFVAGGYEVVYDGILGPWYLERFITGLRRAGVDAPIDYAVLLPDVETCVQRVTDRVGHAFADESATRHMHDQCSTRRGALPDRHLLGTTAGVDAVLAELRARRTGGSLRVGPTEAAART